MPEKDYIQINYFKTNVITCKKEIIFSDVASWIYCVHKR